MAPSPPELDPRVALAAERTLLAWIRTGIALMGFGFVVARFGLFLRELADVNAYKVPAGINASSIGVVLVAAGIAVNIWASVRHVRLIGRYTRGEPLDVSPSGPVAVGLATALGGLVLTAVLLSALAR